jgi:transposase
LELSQSTWLLTALLPGSQKFSVHQLTAGDVERLLALLERLRERVERQSHRAVPVVTIYEAGLDGFWLHRALRGHGIENHVVDAGSVAAPRRRRRAKSDRLDGEALIRVLAAWRRGEPRVCSMVAVPTPAQEDARRLSRERQQPVAERTALSNRIRGLLASQGVRGYDPLRRDRRRCLLALTTHAGQPLPGHLRAELTRMLDRLELTLRQIAAVESERDALLAEEPPITPLGMLMALRSIANQSAYELWTECLYRQFAGRRQVAAYAGLAATPWRSGSLRHEQGLSQAGNPRVRKLMIQLSWLWLRYQPDSVLARWFRARVKEQGARARRIAIVALARKLLVALWRYVNDGVVPEGAVLKPTAAAA